MCTSPGDTGRVMSFCMGEMLQASWSGAASMLVWHSRASNPPGLCLLHQVKTKHSLACCKAVFACFLLARSVRKEIQGLVSSTSDTANRRDAFSSEDPGASLIISHKPGSSMRGKVYSTMDLSRQH